MATKLHALQDELRPSQVFIDRYREVRDSAKRLVDDLDAAAAYIDRNGPTRDVAPRLLACMLSASSVMGALMKAAITLTVNQEK